MNISTNAISRISRYHSVLCRFKTYGARTIYSCDIADTLGLTAAQVRKDFSMFKFTGRKKVGYNIDQLIRNIELLMRKNEAHRAVLCGESGTGTVMFIEQLFAAHGIVIAAKFDTAVLTTSKGNIPGKPVESLFRFIADNGIRFGIITAPGRSAQRMLDCLVMAGIKGVLNLSGVDLKSPKSCVVVSVNVAGEFGKLIYFVNNRQKGKGTENT